MDPFWLLGRVVLLGRLLQLVSRASGDGRHYSLIHRCKHAVMSGSPGKVTTWEKPYLCSQYAHLAILQSRPNSNLSLIAQCHPEVPQQFFQYIYSMY